MPLVRLLLSLLHHLSTRFAHIVNLSTLPLRLLTDRMRTQTVLCIQTTVVIFTCAMRIGKNYRSVKFYAHSIMDRYFLNFAHNYATTLNTTWSFVPLAQVKRLYGNSNGNLIYSLSWPEIWRLLHEFHWNECPLTANAAFYKTNYKYSLLVSITYDICTDINDTRGTRLESRSKRQDKILFHHIFSACLASVYFGYTHIIIDSIQINYFLFMPYISFSN